MEACVAPGSILNLTGSDVLSIRKVSMKPSFSPDTTRVEMDA